MKKIEAIILDFDGLIMDTETPAYESWRRIYRKYGVELPLREWAACVGRGMVFDPHAHLETLTGRPFDREALRAERQSAVKSQIANLPLLPGVKEIFEQAGELRLKLGVASSSPRAWVEGHLRRVGLLDHLQATQCAEDVTHTKPDPELFMKTLNALDARPPQTIVFEDSPNGVLAANRAHIFCVLTTNPITDQLSFDGAHIDFKVDSLADLDLKNLISKLESGELPLRQ